MTDKLDLPRRYLDQLEALLREHVPDAEVWAYGSRVTGKSHDGSDLDIVLRSPTLEPLGDGYLDLIDALEQSNIPILVQAHDWARLPESFHREIERGYVLVQRVVSEPKGTMEDGWAEIPFSEAVEINPSVPLDRGVVYPFVDMASVNADTRSAKSVQEREFQGGGSRFQDGDTLMARITPCLENGKIARYQSSGTQKDAHGSTEFIVIRGRPNVTDNDFAYYLTQWKEVRNYAIGQMTGTSGRQRVPVDSLDHLTVPLPPVSEQRTIAHILGTLDDKIELNRRMNQTLEEMARTIFQDWFVDFGPVHAKLEGREPYLPPELWDLFPDRLVDSELGEIPEEWEAGTVGDVANIAGGSTPSTKVAEYWDGGCHYWATPKDLSALLVPVLLDTERKITNAGLGRISSGLLPAGTVLLSSRAPIGYLAINEMPMAVNQGFIAITPREHVSNLFLLHWCRESIEDIVSYANGSTFLEISKSNFRQIPLPIPPKTVMDCYQSLTTNLHRKIVENERASRTIAAQRDVLVPRLVSGEVRAYIDLRAGGS